MLCLSDVIDDSRIPAKIIFFKGEGHRKPVHWHTNLEVKYLSEGRNNIYMDGICHELKAGGIGVINQGTVHFTRPEDPRSLCGLTLVFSNNYIKRFCPELEGAVFEAILSPDTCPEAFYILKEIYDIYDTGYLKDKEFSVTKDAAYMYLKIKGLLDIFLYDLMTFYRCGDKRVANLEGSKYKERYLEIAKYIEEHFRESINLNEIASNSGLTREHFSRSFKKYMGVTFGEYLNDVRIAQAYRLLANTDTSVLDIALECGFPDMRAFIRCFRRQYGNSPAEYRRRLKV